MQEQIIFLKERFSFLLDHIELFLEDYNRLTETYPYTDNETNNHFDFYFISNTNRFIWEHFHIDVNDFYISSNEKTTLSGLVKGKTYVVPPFFEKQKIEQFLKKLERYQFAVGNDVSSNYSEEMEQIFGELNDNQINLKIEIAGELHLFSFEQLCRMIIDCRHLKEITTKMKEKSFTSRLSMELGYLEEIISEQTKITV